MALESGNYITDLVITNPVGGDLKSTLDDHARLIKKTVKQSFPAISGAVTATHTQLNTVPDLAPKASPTFTGTPAAPTAALGTSTTQLATTAFVANTSFSTNLPAQAGSAGKFLTTDGTNASFGAVPKTVVLGTSGTTWTCPAGVYVVTVHVQGGGGGGGRSTVASPGCGGGGGGYARLSFACVPATVYTISIGGGGAAATVDGTSGAAGSATTFDTGSIVLTGAGGAAGSATTTAYTLGGTGSNGDLGISGGAGSSVATAGASRGGDSYFGRGGLGSSTSPTGYGAGGYGRETGATGSAGSQGCIVLEY